MLLRAPAGLPTPIVAIVAMVLLAVVDVGGAYATKEAVVRRSLPWAITGVALFVLLFYVYASSLQYAELTLVTLGWVVLLQVGVVLLDRFRYGQVFGLDKWLAIVLILAAQTYLLLAPASAPGAAAGRPG
jgi:multidrug transporter EmrE-like cation transporter